MFGVEYFQLCQFFGGVVDGMCECVECIGLCDWGECCLLVLGGDGMCDCCVGFGDVGFGDFVDCVFCGWVDDGECIYWVFFFCCVVNV